MGFKARSKAPHVGKPQAWAKESYKRSGKDRRHDYDYSDGGLGYNYGYNNGEGYSDGGLGEAFGTGAGSSQVTIFELSLSSRRATTWDSK